MSIRVPFIGCPCALAKTQPHHHGHARHETHQFHHFCSCRTGPVRLVIERMGPAKYSIKEFFGASCVTATVIDPRRLSASDAMLVSTVGGDNCAVVDE